MRDGKPVGAIALGLFANRASSGSADRSLIEGYQDPPRPSADPWLHVFRAFLQRAPEFRCIEPPGQPTVGSELPPIAVVHRREHDRAQPRALPGQQFQPVDVPDERGFHVA
ncbi:MAG: hypothetical protein M3Q65_04295 [Chloroflexota bacterium]|nr:hypothetical protein [Chloroflexota bacterium]